MTATALDFADNAPAAARPDLRYDFEVDLPDDVTLRVLMWTDDTESTHLYTYHYARTGEEGKVDLVNRLTVAVTYHAGAVRNVEVQMRVVLPANLGQRHLFGVDISPNAKWFLVFSYRPVLGDDRWQKPLRMYHLQVGRHTVAIPDGDEAALLPTIEVDWPFPIPGDLQRFTDGGGAWGPYRVPYLHNDGTVKMIEFSPQIGQVY